jgi:hypothetical protein
MAHKYKINNTRVQIKSVIRINEQQTALINAAGFSCGSTKGVDCETLKVNTAITPSLLIVDYK